MRRGELEKPPEQRERTRRQQPEKKIAKPSSSLAAAFEKSGFRVKK
jgi:hypothetical protein